jgi:3-deoxy-7-phosphoheptulonate synthase
MLIRWKSESDPAGRANVVAALVAVGARYFEIPGGLVVVSGESAWMSSLESERVVASVQKLATPYKLAARAVRPEGSRVRVGDVVIGGEELIVVGGPCSVETPAQMHEIAHAVARTGARMLRAGAYKPRTSPYAFRGHGVPGLVMLRDAGLAASLPTVTEVMAIEDLADVAAHADMLQIGARNAQNYALLEAAGRTGKAILLKRGPAMTIEELLLAAEYILATGNWNVILCERGIRGHDKATRNTLDLGAVAALKRATHLPVLVDPSHACGRRDLIAPLSRAAVAAGADGLLIEAHPRPTESWSDAEQAISPPELAAIMHALALEAPLHGRFVAGPRGATDEETIAASRERIDAIDVALVKLLDERINIALEIGRAKRAMGRATHVPEREALVLQRVAELAHDPAIVEAFAAIVNATRSAQEHFDDAAE